MFKKIIALLVFICVLSTSVAANGVAGVPYKFIDVPACYGTMYVQITSPIPVAGYTLPSCTKENDLIWKCPCQKSLSVLTPVDTNSVLSFKVQYYIDKTKPIPANSSGGSPDEQYNENFKRIYNINDIRIEAVTNINDPLNELNTNIDGKIGDFVLFIAMLIIFFLLFVVGVAVAVYVWGDKIKKWWQMKTDSKEKKIKWYVKLFGRTSIERTVIGPAVSVKVVNKVQPKTESAEEKIRKMLEDVQK